MKKYILFSTLLCICTSTIKSQEVKADFHYSAKIGANISFLNLTKMNEKIFSSDILIGFNGAFKTSYTFINSLSVNAEAMVSSNNYSLIFVSGHNDLGEKYTSNLRYYSTNLSIPLYVSYLFNIAYFELGAAYSYKITMTELLDCPETPILINYPNDNYKEFNSNVYTKHDIAIIGGFGIKLNRLTVYFRYSYGFVNLIQSIRFNSPSMEAVDHVFNPNQQSVSLNIEYRIK